MWSVEFITGLLFISCLAIRDIELTPIVTLPPGDRPIGPGVTEIRGTTTPTFDISTPIITTIFSGSSATATEAGPLNEVTVPQLGQNETSVTTELPIAGNYSNSDIESTVVQKPIQIAKENTENYMSAGHEATVPEELVIKIESSTLPMDNNDTLVTEVAVTSKPLRLKGSEHVLKGERINSTIASGNGNITTISNPIKSLVDKNDTKEVVEGSYKEKAPVEYHRYIDEILDFGESDSNFTAAAPTIPTRIKSESYQSSQNTISPSHPYGPLAKFDENEMNKLRLNHWRVRQILKGQTSPTPYVAPKPGQSGTDKGNTPDRYFLFGQKRASSSAAEAIAAAASVLSSTTRSSYNQDEFHSSLMASDGDALAMENADRPCPPSKLRSFFNWISNPLKKRKPTTSEEDERLKQARAQQPILPFALGYRGDFLFW